MKPNPPQMSGPADALIVELVGPSSLAKLLEVLGLPAKRAAAWLLSDRALAAAVAGSAGVSPLTTQAIGPLVTDPPGSFQPARATRDPRDQQLTGLPAWSVLLTVDATNEATLTDFELRIADLHHAGVLGSTAVTSDPKAQQLWTQAELVDLGLAPRSPRNYEVTAPAESLGSLIAAVERLLAGSFPGAQTAWHGNVGAGRLELAVLPPRTARELALFSARVHDLDNSLTDLVGRFGSATIRLRTNGL